MFSKLFKFLFPSGRSNVFRGRMGVSPETESKIRRDWENVEVLLKQKGPSQLKQALLTADKSLDNALRDVVPGQTMGERLKNAKDKFEWPVYNKIWEAHKIRNSLVHESDFDPPYHVIITAVGDLKRGLVALGVRL
jgi:hypothetical protein